MATLGDYVTLQRGNTYKSGLLGQPGPVLLGLGSIQRNGGFKADKLETYGGESDPRILLQPGDIYVSLKDVTQSADLLGAVAQVPSYVKVGRLTQDTVKLVFKSNDVCPNYIYWLLRTPQYRAYCKAHATGTTNLGLPREDFLSFEIPDLTPERSFLLQTLVLLEEKIELNRRMNETLEAMAQAIFRDWFVDFGPTRRKLAGITDPVEIMGGLVQDASRAAELAALFPETLRDNGLPEGWEATEVGELFEINPSEPLMRGSIAPYTDMASLPTKGPTAAAPVDRPFTSGPRFRNGDALLARITPCLENGKAAFVDFLPDNSLVGWGSTEFIVLRSRPPVPKPMAYLLVRDPEFRNTAIQSMTGTSGRQRAQTEVLRKFQVARAPVDIYVSFNGFLDPMFRRIRSNASQNDTLAAIRDLLLPKLMSGEIRIREAEEIAEAVQ